MAGIKRPAADDGDSSEDEFNVAQVIRTKNELDKIRKDREKKRVEIQTALDVKLADLRTRVQRSVTAHTRQLGDVHTQQIDRLLRAIETRDSILQVIAGKLSVMQEEGIDLAKTLEAAYAYRMKRVAMPVVDQRTQTDEKARVDAA